MTGKLGDYSGILGVLLPREGGYIVRIHLGGDLIII
jgi:hypothetical protein